MSDSDDCLEPILAHCEVAGTCEWAAKQKCDSQFERQVGLECRLDRHVEKDSRGDFAAPNKLSILRDYCVGIGSAGTVDIWWPDS